MSSEDEDKMFRDATKAMGEYLTKDSGKRDHFDSGMVRDTQKGKARFDLMFPVDVPYDQQMITRFAKLLARGAEKYGDRNWEKGDSDKEIARARSSALRHMMQWACGETDEDHAAAVMFNIMMVETVSFRLAGKMQKEDLVFVSPPNCDLCGELMVVYGTTRDGSDGSVTMTYDCYSNKHDRHLTTITIPVEPAVVVSEPVKFPPYCCEACFHALYQSETDPRRWMCPIDEQHGWLLVLKDATPVWMSPPPAKAKLDGLAPYPYKSKSDIDKPSPATKLQAYLTKPAD